MRRIICLAAILSSVSLVAAGPTYAASGDTYKAKKAACQQRAKTMKFGIHLIKKNRWVKDCIAGKHQA